MLVLGATGTIGRATVRALVRRGHDVVCFVRPRAGVGGELTPDDSAKLLQGSTVRFGDVTDPASLARDGFRGERFDALVSCLASRTGAPKDAWAIDYQAHVNALAVAQARGRFADGAACRRSACRSRVSPFSMRSWRSRKSSWSLA